LYWAKSPASQWMRMKSRFTCKQGWAGACNSYSWVWCTTISFRETWSSLSFERVSLKLSKLSWNSTYSPSLMLSSLLQLKIRKYQRMTLLKNHSKIRTLRVWWWWIKRPRSLSQALQRLLCSWLIVTMTLIQLLNLYRFKWSSINIPTKKFKTKWLRSNRRTFLNQIKT
jgi:hypothetical protein